MKSAVISDPSVALNLIDILSKTGNYINVDKEDVNYKITWLKHKKYTSYDGTVQTDKVWTKEDGTMIVCQDLTLEHARNIVRMLHDKHDM